MNSVSAISNYLTQVEEDWKTSRGDFPQNTFPPSQWPIPFFGNPATALVATVGVNPSSDEFTTERYWPEVKEGNRRDWKERLRDYFKHTIPAHQWFEPWRIGMELVGTSYEAGSAAHFDVSYRTTTAMITNPRTDREEFRRMVERDVAWFFKLLLLCPHLRLLLTFGPILGANLQPESLFAFLFDWAPAYGFRASQEGGHWSLWHEPSRRGIQVHDADTPGEKCVTCRVVRNLHAHRHALRHRLAQPG